MPFPLKANIEFKDMKVFVRGLPNLPNNIMDALGADNGPVDEFTKTVVRSAKQRAPKDTGFLRNSIRRIKEDPRHWLIIADAPYAQAWEEGFRPHWIHRSMDARNGQTVGDRMDAHGIPFAVNFIFAGKNKNIQPFMGPAFEAGRKKLQGDEITSSFRKSVRKSFGLR